MPHAPKRPCRHPGCPALVNGRFCDTHLAEHNRTFDRDRGTAAQRGYDARHRRWRALVLARYPICVDCGMRPSTEADHVIPLEQGGDWSLENGRGRCKGCHSRKTRRENMGARG